MSKKRRRSILLILVLILSVWGVLRLLVPGVFGSFNGIQHILSLVILMLLLFFILGVLSIDMVSVSKTKIHAAVAIYVFGYGILAYFLRTTGGETPFLLLLQTYLLIFGVGGIFLAKSYRIRSRGTYTCWGVMHAGVGSGISITTVLMCTMSLGLISQQQWSCSMLVDGLTSASLYAAPILGLSDEQVAVLPEQIDAWSTRPVSALVGLSGSSQLSYDQIIGEIEKAQIRIEGVHQTGSTNLGLVSLITAQQKKLLTNITRNKDLINQGLCSIVVSEIKKTTQQGWFNVSVFFLLVFVFSPILSILFRISVLLWWALLRLLILLGIYRWKNIIKEVPQLV